MIAARSDLLVIGGLTIDRFADGSSAPGGSVLHIARAVAPRGTPIAVITVAGPEPVAQVGLDELRSLAVALDVTAASATTTFIHRETPGGRRLRLERHGGQLRIAGSPLLGGPRAVLVAPIAGEIDVDDLAQLESVPFRVAILQGWLRGLDEQGGVQPVTLGAVPASLVAALSRYDLLVASREDLAAEYEDAPAQLAGLRRAFGARPALILTCGSDGAWIAVKGPRPRHLPVSEPVAAASTVGAGDILAAFVTVALMEGGGSLEQRTRAAMRTVAEILARRRS